MFLVLSSVTKLPITEIAPSQPRNHTMPRTLATTKASILSGSYTILIVLNISIMSTAISPFL